MYYIQNILLFSNLVRLSKNIFIPLYISVTLRAESLLRAKLQSRKAINTLEMAPKWVLKDAFPCDDHPNFGLSLSLQLLLEFGGRISNNEH
jgi:hypothetical protein